jgi:alkylmercury lyase
MSDYVERTIAVIRNIEGHELLLHAIRLLSEGEPVELERLAEASGWSLQRIEAALEETKAERDEQGRLVGLSLSLRATPHCFTSDGRTVYAWCATDTLMFPVMLGRPASVESTCPWTGEPIRIELTPDRIERLAPPDAFMSAVRPRRKLEDVRAATCDLGHFFSSREAAARWAEEHPESYIHSVEEGFRLDRQVIERLGWDAARQPVA